MVGNQFSRTVLLWSLKAILVAGVVLMPLVFPDSKFWYALSGVVIGGVVSLLLLYRETTDGVFAQMFGDGSDLQLHGQVARVIATWLVLLLLLTPMFFALSPALCVALAGGMLGGVVLAEVLWAHGRL